MIPMPSPAKQALVDLAEQLPDDCSWDDAMYQLYVRQKIAAGLEAEAAGRLIDHDEVFAELEHADAHSFLPGSRTGAQPPAFTAVELAELRGKLEAWEEDWNAPGMEAYDEL
jgi:predicted transcriptional regulator